MSVIRRIISISTSALLLAGPVLAQDAAGQRAANGPAVSASSTAAGVRFVAPGEARRIRLEVYAASGERLFDSGFRAGGIYDWDGQGLADGSYLCVLTAEDIRGGRSRRLSSVAVAGGRAALAGEGEGQLKSSFAQAIAAAGIRQDEAEAAARARQSNAVTVAAHDGTDGQVTSASGSLTFRTGDVFAGRDKEQMRVTPEGRVGIGTDRPEEALDVAGVIRARGGIRFEDGTVLTSAGGLKSGLNISSTSIVSPGASAATSGGGPAVSAIAGTGTVNKLAKWLDGAGTVGDSSILETNGLTVFGRSTPLLPDAANFHLVEMAAPGTKTPLVLVGGSGSMEFWKDTAGAGGGPTAAMAMGMAVPGTAATNDIILSTINAGAWGERLRVTQSGDVKLSGAGKGIIFPDGTKQTSAAVSVSGSNTFTGANVFSAGLSANNARVTNVGNPTSAGDAVNKAYTDANFVKFVPGAEQLSVGDANGTTPMINLAGSNGSATPNGRFRVNHDGGLVAAGTYDGGASGAGVPAEGPGTRMMWHPKKGAFRAGGLNTNSVFDHSTNGTSNSGGTQWDDANIGLYSVALGENVRANGDHSVAFGKESSAAGSASFAAGESSIATGGASVALGFHAHTNARQGSFVFSDRSAVDSFRAGANHSASWRVSGGFRVFTSSNLSTGVTIQSGAATSNWGQSNAVISTSTGAFLSTGGVWTNASSRALKTGFAGVDSRSVLRKVLGLPILTWRYKSEAAGVRHMGPMSQDFSRAFNLGSDDRAIGTVDVDGVALAAIQGLNEELKDRDAKIVRLEEQVERQQAMLDGLKRLVCSQNQTAEVCK